MSDIKYPTNKKLYPFQIETIEKTLSFFAANKSKAAYVANQMGTGKSPTSVVTANTLNAKHVLIVCPAVMRLTWETEVKNWTTLDSPTIQVVLTGKDLTTKTERTNYLITSYSLAATKTHADILSKMTFDLVICDESHYLKNFKALRTKALLKSILPNGTYKLLLSGTPMTSGAADLYTTFNFILPELFPTWHYFVNRYCHRRVTPFATLYTGVKNSEELSQVIRKYFYIRYRKEDVLKELPGKQHQHIRLESKYSVKLHGKSAAEEKQLTEDIKKVEDALKNGKVVVLPASLAEHRRLQGEAKAPAVAEYAKELLEQNIPLVIFAHHKNVIAKLKELLSVYNPYVVTGETSMPDRQAAIDGFQAGKSNLFIGNYVAAGIGCTLTKASTVLLAEVDYSPAVVNQAIDRCHRIGQKDSVNIYWFVVEKSIDERIESIVRQKTLDFEKLLDKS